MSFWTFGAGVWSVGSAEGVSAREAGDALREEGPPCEVSAAPAAPACGTAKTGETSTRTTAAEAVAARRRARRPVAALFMLIG